EIIAKKGAKVRYTTLQNWSSDVYNLVTKRAYAYEDASVEWIDANVGSKLTMKYPSVYLVGPRAKAEIVSVAFAGKDRHQDTGAKAVHLAPYTSSRITAKSVSKDGGLTTYRGLVHVAKGAVGVKSSVRCDALLMDDQSKTTTYPDMEVNEDDATITHEATVGRINEDQLFYLMSRGLTETQALSMIVTGFMEPFTRVLPMEYAVEFNRLIEIEMEAALLKFPDLARNRFTKAVPPGDDKFAALNDAFFTAGTFLYVPKGLSVKIPFRNIVLLKTHGQASFTHNIIVAEENSKVNFLQ